ncbi:hypothetical protein BAUCODRAFT_378571 [Baudoinia panamericana UAMH 10762]|uniref:Nitrogen permease regulator 2 n=1 Tax=Baudoinia panamericana (strain UAMH 10762) TaxID=717646 RepID=M2NI02_BAUPA|nr:uncharacterized protein BAUCODRAFT_378571 [Baudoinia panamericana UAMH 10762]EMC98710.1 hypothetical protein BAUCODRAFT_378571 [Baudoinia panamericana UAMH 10762]
MMLNAVFYARFHPERGPCVVHQQPADSIVTADISKRTLISFSDISAYIIPPYGLCNRSLSISTNGYRVLGFPISLEDFKYERNRFTFSICFVLREDTDVRLWTSVVAKTAAFFRSMEEEDGLLQAEERLSNLIWAGDKGYPAPNVGVVYSLLEDLIEDLNAYAETCIRINDVHVLNLRLTKPHPAVADVKSWDVPLLVRPLPDQKHWTWDLTLARILPHVDGIKHIQRIADILDVELKLVKRAVKNLIYHERAMLLDIFHFQAIYMPTANFARFVQDEEMLEECRMYVNIDSPVAGHMSSVPTPETQDHAKNALISLYTSLLPGLTLQNFVLANEHELATIDIRRFITFGVIQGFLRRIHKYALAFDSTSPSTQMLGTTESSPSKSKPRSNEDALRDFERAWKNAALSSGWSTPPMKPPSLAIGSAHSERSQEERCSEEDERLRWYIDGTHCLDEVCMAMKMSQTKLVERLRGGNFGEVIFVNK